VDKVPEPAAPKMSAEGKMEAYFLDKIKKEEFDPTNFSIAKLMHHHSKQRIDALKEKEYDVFIQKKGKKKLTRDEIKQKMSEAKTDVVRDLPRNLFRLGLTNEDMKQHTSLVQQAMGLHNASIAELRKARLLEIRARFGYHERDTASPGITASVLCEDVVHLLNHLKIHKKDTTAFLKLREAVHKRKIVFNVCEKEGF